MSVALYVTDGGTVGRSTDGGQTWSNVSMPVRYSGATGHDVITDGGGNWVLAFDFDIAVSTDNGLTFSPPTSVSMTNYAGATDGGGTWVLVGAGGAEIQRSTDLVTFSAQTQAHGSTTVNDIIWDGSKFVAVGNSGKVQTSADGSSWTAKNDVGNGGNATAIGYGLSGDYYAVLSEDSGGTPNGGISVFTSRDLTTWSRITGIDDGFEAPFASPTGIMHVQLDGVLVGTGNGNLIYGVGTDSANWGQIGAVPLGGNGCYSISFSGTEWVIGDWGGAIYTADYTDTESWTARTSGTGSPLNGMGATAESVGPVASFLDDGVGAPNYSLKLTGAGDSLADLDLPMADLQVILSNQRLSSLDTTIPSDTYLEGIEARPNGELVVSGYRVKRSGVVTNLRELFRFPYPRDISTTYRPESAEISMRSEDDATYSAANELTLANAERLPERGRVMIRADVNFDVRPTDTVTIGVRESFVVGQVTYTIAPDNAYIEVAEFIEDDGAEDA